MSFVKKLIAAVSIAASAACWAGAAEAGKVRLGMTTWVGYGPLFLARDMGFFKDAGVDVDLQIIEEASLYMAAVASGDLDGSVSTVDEMMKYRSQDMCFKYVLAVDDSHGGDGVITGEDVNSLADLKGKDVALNEGSVSEFWFTVLLKKAGMSKNDVSIVNMTADDAATAFIAKRVPAAVTWEPHLTSVRKNGQGKVLVDSSTTPGLIVDVITLDCKFVDEHPDDVRALVSAYYKAVDFIRTNPEKAYEVMAAGIGGYLKDPKDFADAAKGVNYYDQARNVEFFGDKDKSQISDLIKYGGEIWGEAGKLKMTLDDAALVDRRFVVAK